MSVLAEGTRVRITLADPGFGLAVGDEGRIVRQLTESLPRRKGAPLDYEVEMADGNLMFGLADGEDFEVIP